MTSEQEDRLAVDVERLRRGGIPVQAERRLLELGEAGAGRLAFTSDLSPDEAGLLRRHGYQPLGLVTGSAVYHVGQAYASIQGDVEVSVLSSAYDEATRLAVSRLEQEARAVKAEGVVGVRYSMLRQEWTQGLIEVQVIGTAVRGPQAGGQAPWLSDLSGQEWWALYRAGYEPAGLVWGHCVWFILTDFSDLAILQGWTNQELGHFSRGLTWARDRAMRTMQGLAQRLHAIGVVGVRVARRLDEIHLTPTYGSMPNPLYEVEHHNLTLSLIGTAIRERTDAPRRIRATALALSLRDGKLTRVTRQAADASFQ